MADHDDGAVVIHQELFQPVDGLNVQTVGGLVQQDDGGLAEQSLCQQHLHLLAAVQRVHLGVVQVGGQAQAAQQLVDLGLGIPAAHLGKFRFQLTGALAVRLGEILLGIQLVLFLHDVVQAAVAHDDGLHHRELVVFVVVLLQHAHPVIRTDGHTAAGGLDHAGDDFQQGGLTGAVGTDDTVAVARHKIQVHILVQIVALKLQTYVIYRKHNNLAYPSFSYNRTVCLK